MQTTETTHQMPTPSAKEGEKYAGTIINPDGTGRHIYLLPGDNDDASQQEQMKWAESIGGDLPDRVESALLFNQSADEFKKKLTGSTKPMHAMQSGLGVRASLMGPRPAATSTSSCAPALSAESFFSHLIIY